ncbi:MAG: TVP38/TMEM64 family protein, partial [Alphaproteobacteria bacterium]
MTQDSIENEKHRGSGFAPLRLIPIAVLAAGLAAFFIFDLGHYLSLESLGEHRSQLMEWVRDSGATAALAYVVVYAVVIAFSLPGGALMTIAGGFLLGPALGASLAAIGATAGATALFLAARYASADYLHAKAGPALHRMEDGFKENALNYLLVLRLIPLFPFWLVNLVPALLGVRLGTYV